MKAKIATDAGGLFYGIEIKCPAGHEHILPTDWTPPGMERSPHKFSASWTFNGDFENPTFSPSILMRQGHFAKDPPVPGNCACDFNERYPEEEPWEWPCCRCHSYVRDGKIEFLNDCTHALSGQTVELPEVNP